jgi:protein phosphatase
LRSAWLKDSSGNAESFVRALKQAAKAANEQIHAYAASHPEFRGMGTTATIAGLLGDTLYLAQVGDSRAYLVRDGVARQITKDQSLMQKLIEAGELTEEEAEHSERRNIILQALGPEASIKIDLTHQTVRRGDALVLCSDGLSGQVTKDDIASVVTKESDLTNACRELIDRANANGGPDNITVIIARFDGTGLVGAGTEDHVGHKVFPLQETGQTPAMPMDRVLEEDTPTKPVPIPDEIRRMVRPTPADIEASTRPTERTMPTPTSEPVVQVSPERRNKGRLIAITLFAVLIATAAWYVFSQVKSTTAPTATPTTPSK